MEMTEVTRIITVLVAVVARESKDYTNWKPV